MRKGLLLKPSQRIDAPVDEHAELVFVRHVIERNKSIPRKIGKVRNPEYLPMRKTNSPHVWSRVLGSDVDVLKVGTVKIRYRDPVMRFTIQADVKRCP